MSRKATTALACAAALLVAPIGACAAQEHPETEYFAQFEGVDYHVYADGIDWSAPVGVLYYLDGDYFDPDESEVLDPEGAFMTDLAGVANDRNMVMVAPTVPAEKGEEGVTWWEELDYNADWFRSFATEINETTGVDPARVWFMGYSGGAEFISLEIAAQHQDQYGTGGGIIVGGGDAPETYTEPPAAVKEGLDLAWVVGEDDVAEQTNPPGWSALDAATEGQAFYEGAGFARTTLTVEPGVGHEDYDFPAILADNLPAAEVSPR